MIDFEQPFLFDCYKLEVRFYVNFGISLMVQRVRFYVLFDMVIWIGQRLKEEFC